MTTLVATLALVTTLSSGPAAPGRSSAAGQENPPTAQTVDASNADAIRRRVKEGQKVRVTDDQGREWQGRIERFAPDTLELLPRDRQRRDLPYSSILRIDRPDDTLTNGAGIGFAFGAVLGMLAVIAEENADCDPGFFSCGNPTAAAYILLPAIVGGAGAGIGIGIDALVRRDSTLFRRGESRVILAPSLGPGLRGLSLSMRW